MGLSGPIILAPFLWEILGVGGSAREGVPGRQQEQEKFAFQHFAYVKLGVCQSIMQMSSVALQTFCGLPHLAHAAVVVSALSWSWTQGSTKELEQNWKGCKDAGSAQHFILLQEVSRFSPNSMSHWGVAIGKCKGRCPVSVLQLVCVFTCKCSCQMALVKFPRAFRLRNLAQTVGHAPKIGPRHDSQNSRTKMTLVKCPRAFRLHRLAKVWSPLLACGILPVKILQCPRVFRWRRLARSVVRGLSLRHYVSQFLHKVALVKCPRAFRLRRLVRSVVSCLVWPCLVLFDYLPFCMSTHGHVMVHVPVCCAPHPRCFAMLWFTHCLPQSWPSEAFDASEAGVTVLSCFVLSVLSCHLSCVFHPDVLCLASVCRIFAVAGDVVRRHPRFSGRPKQGFPSCTVVFRLSGLVAV